MYGESNVPSPNAGFLAVAAGANHCLGLKQDGSIVAWGSNEFNQCSVPSPNTGFVAVAAGAYHSIGIKQNGSIVAWGSNSSGQCNVPSPNTGFKAVAGGQNHSIGLKQNGSIVAWGDNTYGQCNVPPPTGSAPGNDQNNPVPSENLPPNADAGEDQIVTGSDGNGSVQVTLDGSDSADPNGSIVSYVWFEGGNQIATGVKPTVSLSVGRHIITLTVTDNTGLTDTDAIAITVETP
jgi:hypothetical protein